MTGTLVVCGTPLGNVGDASQRLREALSTADIVAAEDTRRFRRLASDLDLDISAEVVSYFEANERGRVPQLVERMLGGACVALVTDAGMPAISDPGYRLVKAAAEAGVAVRVVPGPSSVTTALAVSGLPSDRWVFEGFLPRRGSERRARIAALAAEARTVVLLESPRRAAAALAELAAGFGADRPAVLCRELTKTYEEVLRLPLGELARWAAEREVRGELTIVIGVPRSRARAPSPSWLRRSPPSRRRGWTARRRWLPSPASPGSPDARSTTPSLLPAGLWMKVAGRRRSRSSSRPWTHPTPLRRPPNYSETPAG